MVFSFFSSTGLFSLKCIYCYLIIIILLNKDHVLTEMVVSPCQVLDSLIRTFEEVIDLLILFRSIFTNRFWAL